MVARTTFYFKVMPDLYQRYTILKSLGYLKTSDIALPLEERLRELLALKASCLPPNDQLVVAQQVQDSLSRRFNNKSKNGVAIEPNPAPIDSFFHIPNDSGAFQTEDQEPLPEVETEE